QAKNHSFVEGEHRVGLGLVRRMDQQSSSWHMDNFVNLAVRGTEDTVTIRGREKEDRHMPVVELPRIQLGEKRVRCLLNPLHREEPVTIEPADLLHSAVAGAEEPIDRLGDGPALRTNSAREQGVE